MSRVMLVNVTHVEESRVAILDDGVLAEYDIETINRTSLKGNIYNVVVESVHPSLEAAFVKIGADLKGFLPLDEVNFKLLPARSDSRKQGKIGQHLHPGQKLMAQVVREPFAGKPPTVSTYFSLPGRYLVLMPGVDSSGISRKIEDGKQRDRLKKILGELKAPEGFGLILRTAGVGQTKTEIQRDLRYLLRLWESIQKGSKSAEFPGLVYREADLVIRTIRDHLTPDIGEVWIDSRETHDRALAFAKDVMPKRAKILRLYTGDRPLFNKFNLEEQIERIYKRRVPLPSGGEIVIDGTEALTAIDVNSARSRRSGDLEDNALQTNLEAAAEIARQLRLRDLGGLIVVDFIDMGSMRNKKKVEKTMRDAMRVDRAKYDVTVISKLGLMELARQRIKSAKMAATYATCPSCDGHGLIKNIEPAALSALRKLQTRSMRGGFGRLRLSLPPEVAAWLLNHKREEVLRLERQHDIVIEIRSSPSLLRHDSEFEVFPREKGDEASSPAGREAGRSVAGERTATASREGAAPSTSAPREEAPAKAARGSGKSADSSNGAAAETAEAAKVAPAAEEEGTRGSESPERRGRRRKRRRRSRSSNHGSPESGRPRGETSEKEPPAGGSRADDGWAVPRGIRADELMPAASGSGGLAAGKSKKKKPSSRRQSRGGSRSGRSRRAASSGNGS